MRILIADDDRMSTVMLVGTLEKWGFETVVAYDGLDAWHRITEAAPPQLAILDWMMPGIDGPELCRRVRAAPLATPIYLILLTARTGRGDVVEGLDAGADDYLTKPFDPDELRARIHVGRRTLDMMAHIRQLAGLLPICSYCKRVRSDRDYWQSVESYLAERTDVNLSHGVCPECLAKVLKEIDA